MTTPTSTPTPQNGQARTQAQASCQFYLEDSLVPAAEGAEADNARFASIPVLPAPGAVGRDGRGPFTYDIAEVVANVRANGADIPVFLDHMPGKAVGWLDHTASPIAQADGSYEWPVSYTEEGLALLRSRGYRYNSPTWWFVQDPAVEDRQAGRIVGLQEVSLTNLPNQYLRALNSQGSASGYTSHQPSIVKPMNAEQLALLGLTEDATAEAISAALQSLKTAADKAAAIVAEAGATADAEPAAVVEAAANSRVTAGVLIAKQAYDAVVAERDNALAAAQAAQSALATAQAAQAETAAQSAVDSAISAGKFVPAAREVLLKQARADLASFNALVAVTPVHAAAQSAVQGVATQAVDETHGLSAEHLALCKQNGINPAIFARNLRASA